MLLEQPNVKAGLGKHTVLFPCAKPYLCLQPSQVFFGGGRGKTLILPDFPSGQGHHS